MDSQLLKQVEDVRLKYEQLAKISGEKFNIFHILNVSTYEVRLHSAFIAELLNPKGSHGQNTVFLSLFLQQLKIENFEFEGANVEIEKYISPKMEESGGRIDIFLKNNKSQSITIENKIYAADQDKQLLRYKNYIGDNGRLFYLTLEGDEPDDCSIGTLVKGEHFELISYHTDIVNWLEKCQKEAASFPLLRETIAQYIYLIKHLTGQTTNRKMENEIVDLITKSPENLKNAVELNKALTKAKVKVQFEF